MTVLQIVLYLKRPKRHYALFVAPASSTLVGVLILSRSAACNLLPVTQIISQHHMDSDKADIPQSGLHWSLELSHPMFLRTSVRGAKDS